MNDEKSLPEYLEKAQKVLTVLNMLMLDVEEVILDANDLEAVGNDRLLDACFAWLTMNAIPFVLDDESRLYRLCRDDEWPIR